MGREEKERTDGQMGQPTYQKKKKKRKSKLAASRSSLDG